MSPEPLEPTSSQMSSGPTNSTKMKFRIITTLLTASRALASFDKWSPPGAYDGNITKNMRFSFPKKVLTSHPRLVRGPCPMLNTLANHGFLPHDGKDITREIAANALFDGLHINKTLGGFLFDFGVTTNPKPNATSFSLNDLGNHNILEHDASLRFVIRFFFPDIFA